MMHSTVTNGSAPRSSRLCIGRSSAGAAELAHALDTPLLEPPELTADQIRATIDSGSWAWNDTIETWAEELAAGQPLDHAVIATWRHETPGRSLTDLDSAAWLDSVEYELALWSRAIVAIAERSAPDASIVVIVDRPSPLDAVGHTPALGVAEGLQIFGRSAALVHGEQLIRINTLATSLGTPANDLIGMPPALPTFPGTVGTEIAGAVRALWSPDLVGVSGTVLAVDGGRSW